MCGIAGYKLRGGEASESLVKAMCDQIVHRGPDEDGYYANGACAIGMRRLSIIDLASGRQPISNEDGSIWIVFNGEIYDYAQLRDWLTSRGHSFRTQTDTETIIHLYEEEGLEGLKRLRGMFAFALWDTREKCLTLVRDRFGKKPLYYANNADGFYFGSELKCLTAAGAAGSVSEEALQLYFAFGYIPHPRSVYDNIRKLAAGSWLQLRADGSIEERRYWQAPEAAPDIGQTETTADIEAIRRKFDESVKIRMRSDVPLGAFLSGGVDSASIVASMALQSEEPISTFSIGFEEADFNELNEARATAVKYGTQHHEIVVKPDVVDLVPKIIRQFDEPFGDSSAIPTYVVSEFARRHVTVALSGDGGDELFTGYPSFGQAAAREAAWGGLPSPARKAIRMLATVAPYWAPGKNYLGMIGCGTEFERYLESNYFARFQMERLFESKWLPPAEQGYYANVFKDCLPKGAASAMDTAIYFELTSKLPEDILVKVDRMSMANSLEVRCPLLDHELGELALSYPARLNLGTERGKQLLLKAVGDRLPAEIFALKKSGFSVPLAKWFRGELREFLCDHILSESFLSLGVVRPRFARYLVDEHLSGRRDNRTMLWRLLVFDVWRREAKQSPWGP